MTDDERTEPGRPARRPARPAQTGPPPPWPGEEGTVPGSYQGSRHSAGPNGAPAGYAGRQDPTQPGATPARPQGRTDPLTDPSYAQRPGSGLARPPQPGSGGPGPDAARYLGSPPAGYGDGTPGNGGRSNGNGGQSNGGRSNGGRSGRSNGSRDARGNGDRTAAYRDPAPGYGNPAPGYGGAPGNGGSAGYGGTRGYGGGAGYAPGPYGREGSGPGADSYPGADAYPGDPQYPGEPPYPGDPRYQRDAGYRRGQSYPRDGHYPSDDRYQDDSRYRSDDRHAEPGGYRGRRRSNAPAPAPAPAPEDYPGYTDDPARPADGPGRRAGPAAQHAGGPPWANTPGTPDPGDSRDGYGEDEDDRFVPGLGGPRQYRDGDEDGYEDDGYGDDDGGGDGPRGGSGRKPKRRRSRWIAPLIAVVVILTPVLIGGVYVFNLYQSKYHPADYATAGTGQAIVQVQTGQTATEVGQRLVTLGVVASLRAFELAAEHSPNGRGLEPGFYRVRKQMKATLAFALLLNPASRIQDKITIPEGWRLSQTETALGAHSGIPMADYQQALQSPGALGLPSYANGKPEGFLFPATYTVEPNMSATTVLQAMVNRFNQEATTINLPLAASQAHMSARQVIIIASLLQAEGGSISDYKKIARVIANRLAAGMPLQFDSTVLYGLGQFGTTVTFKQINTDTPYNTYKHNGLPPGPIDSPGNSAIQAALHPASGNWLYFVASKNGVTKFSHTLSGLNG